MDEGYISLESQWLENSGIQTGDNILILETDHAQMFDDVKHVGKQGTVQEISYGILVKVDKTYMRVPFYCLIKAED